LIAAGLQRQSGVLGFYVMLPAVFASSILFDRGSGFLATGLSTVVLYFLARSPHFGVPREFLLPLVLFAVIGFGLALVSEGLRVAWERAIKAERTKDLLLRELGHRTKNNLAMVTSVLTLQARSKTDPGAKLALEKAVSRVQAIASAHSYFLPMHQGRVEMRSYLGTLCSHLGDALRDVRPIALRVDIADVHLSSEQAIPVGLIVNELVTNALKHAFPDERAGAITVSLSGASPLTLTVEDNGVGCEPLSPDGGLGSRLIQMLAQQLGATIERTRASPGCRVRVSFTPA
jgi:two-component sensor histidine kinase